MSGSNNIAIKVILSLVTCGIYAWYWVYTLNEESKELAGRPNDTSGGMVILLSLVTCGIYLLVWHYQMGERMQAALENNGVSPAENRSVLYLLLAIFRLDIVNCCLIQDDINKIYRIQGRQF